MKVFFCFRAREAARGRAEIRAFWKRRGVVFQSEGSPPLAGSLEVSTSSSDVAEDVVVKREYEALMARGASDEELLAWAKW